jgi:S1-C subfamily serine protease
VRVVAQVPGTIIDYNLDRDLGLVSIRTNTAVRVAPVASAQTIIERGHRVTSVGCDRGSDPTALATRVTNVDRYQGPPNIEAGGAPVEGRSGGGLFNSAGELVGVCFAADYEGNEGLYTALESIHDELDRLGLSGVYHKAGGSVQAQNQAVPQPTTAAAAVVRGQEPLETTMPVTDAGQFSQATGPSVVPSQPMAKAGLAPVEQAALEEIMRRAADSEVVCIIRPKDPAGKSEVITLDHVSPEFVKALAEHTSMVSGTLTR